MKKMLALALLLMLMLPCLASADTFNVSNAKDFARFLDQKGIAYVSGGVIQSGSLSGDSINLTVRGKRDEYTIRYLFMSTGDYVFIRVAEDFMQFRSADLGKVLRTVNQLNREDRYAIYKADTETNTIFVTADMFLSDGHVIGETVWEKTQHLVDSLDQAYDQLSMYAK